ncbi:MAG: hypothetical protein HYY10_03250 [Candidatus Liptonbacteria bacterium]|nr:hypothetical protein [Candidatus Liptonbacteria bacterium]
MPRYKIPQEQKVELEQQLHPDRSVGAESHKSSHASNSMSKRFAVSIIAIVVVLVLLGVWAGSFLAGSKQTGASGYTAVFLTSGDVYFGKLSWFPWPKLTKAWFLQRSVDQQNQPQLGLAPFSSVFWGPAGDLFLNPKQILFWAPIAADSSVAKAIGNPASVRQQAPQEQGGQPQEQSQTTPPPAEVKK